MALAQADMTLIYKGTDITKQVDIIECVCRDVSGSESDCLNLKVDHADQWFRWGPQKNDTIQVKRNGYDSKTLYLNTVIPEDGAEDPEITAQLLARRDAKKAKNFAEADRIRDELAAAGIELTDIPNGVKWKKT